MLKTPGTIKKQFKYTHKIKDIISLQISVQLLYCQRLTSILSQEYDFETLPIFLQFDIIALAVSNNWTLPNRGNLLLR